MPVPPSHSFKEDTEFRLEDAPTYGPPGVLNLIPTLTAKGIGEESDRLPSRFTARQAAFKRWNALLALEDKNAGPGIESMVTNDAKTMFALSVFLTSTAEPRRVVATGSQGAVSERRAGLSERALDAWWQNIDATRIESGQEPSRYDLAYWMCLYGWYAVQYAAVAGPNGEMVPVAVPLDPSECYPVYGDGLDRFVRRYQATQLDAQRIAIQFNTPIGVKNPNQPVTIADWYWHSPSGDVVRSVVVKGLPGGGWKFLAEPHELGLQRIPVLVGRVAGNPRQDAYEEAGSVFVELETVYNNFNKWLSFFITHAKEVAKAPIVAHNIDIEETKMSPVDIRQGAAVIETDDPEARVERIQPPGGFVELSSLLSVIDGMLQRGGYPYLVYGGLGRELSGFAISQLLQAADRKIGPHLRRLALIDSLISQHWLESFRDGNFAPSMLSGSEEGNPRKFFVEEFKPSNVPKFFKVITEVPIRIGNDLMARMSIARQAVGGAGPVLDMVTIIGDILEQQDPSLVLDGIARDAARQLVMPLKAALALKQESADILAKYGSAGKEVAALIDRFTETLIAQAEASLGKGAQAKVRIAPNEMPPEQAGISPDVIRAARSEGPTNA